MSSLNNKGFTLIEVVVVVAIMGVVASIAIINMIGWRGERKLEGAARNFFSDMQLAKMQSIREAEPVSVVLNIANSSYRIFVDIDKDATLDTEDRLIRDIEMPVGVTIKASTFGSSTRFDTRGRPNNIGKVTFENSVGTIRGVEINKVGRLLVEYP